MSLASPARVRVVAALIEDDARSTRFLVQQRPPGKSRALLWEFPGGKVEQGESDEVALARECQEELDVELRVEDRIWEGTHTYDDLTVELVLYRARIVRGTPKPLHAHALEYLTPSQMKERPFCAADLPLLDELALRHA